MESTEKIRLPRMVTPYNAQHIGSREEQQDYFSYSNIFDAEERERCGIAAVLADGMGGMENGRQASRTGALVFLNTYLDLPEGNLNDNMLLAAHRANEAVKKINGAGSTLVAAVIKDWRLNWVSIGDSRLYLYRSKRITQMNREHKYANLLEKMVQNGEISIEEARSDPNRAALTSYLGIDTLTEIDISTAEVPLRRGDSVLLCSDGLYNAVSEEEIARIIDDADDDVCEVIVAAAIAKGYTNQDNITVMLLDID